MAKRKKPVAPGGGQPPGLDGEQFDPQSLYRSVIALPLLQKMEGAAPSVQFDVIIDVNLDYPEGRAKAREVVRAWINSLPGVLVAEPAAKNENPRWLPDKKRGINESKSKYSQQYLFGRLNVADIRELARRSDKAWAASKANSNGPATEAHSGDEAALPSGSPLYRIWLDDKVKTFVNTSISTVKADAARNAFGTSGKDILWAVLDTGVDRTHPHFKKHGNLETGSILHRDFTASAPDDVELARTACIDPVGHGTHVAGIIAGECSIKDANGKGDVDAIVATVKRRTETGGDTIDKITNISAMSGMAPQCKILSLKVIDAEKDGHASNLIAALEYIQELNGDGRRILVHGVNMSVGYDFEPKWFACGQSPLCVEVNRLVRSGVVVVVAAGNTGYGYNHAFGRGPGVQPVPAGQDVTINDPGNAELAITVGSTHREMPHVYGVSFFSSKGPTGDGRLKPDIVAPGERILSCQSSDLALQAQPPAAPADTPAPAAGVPAATTACYKEDSGTSMAAPHVSGVIAAFLSVRREFIGNPDAVKQTFMSTATDLKRAVYFQGKGLVDLMRAIQSV